MKRERIERFNFLNAMAPFRGRGGRGRGGRGGRGSNRGGRGRGNFHGQSNGGDRLARSGIRTRNGYKKFDSQRTRDLPATEDEISQDDDSATDDDEDEIDQSDISEDDEEVKPAVRAYNVLLQSFHGDDEIDSRKSKRRKIELNEKPDTLPEEISVNQVDEEGEDDHVFAEPEGDDDVEEIDHESTVDEESQNDPYEFHFSAAGGDGLAARIDLVKSGQWTTRKSAIGSNISRHHAFVERSDHSAEKATFKSIKDFSLKERLVLPAVKHIPTLSDFERRIATDLLNYTDALVSTRTVNNAESLRKLSCLHAVNHVLKGRDRVLKNNDKISHLEESVQHEFRDQGFVRPKVLILCETRQTAARFADCVTRSFEPDQKENKSRFDDSFTAPIDEETTHMPEDYREVFDGNNDNNFLTAIKFTRKSMKFYSAFYSSDIILASPLGLRRIIENEDIKKRDYDFLSSIEIVIVDQADAMQMQNWENVEVVFKHLNLQLKEAHGCDFSRVRNWYLDGNAKFIRQTVVFGAYLTPEMNRLYNQDMNNIAGKAKYTRSHVGAIADLTGLGFKQTFSRFECSNPALDPDARFKYFTSAVLPALLRLPKPADGAPGILVFIPSYFDFLRLRNYFATSDVTENISFGAINDYSEISDQRRARSHFLSGRHSILLYTQRAHHFFRLKIRGVKRMVLYGLPDNDIFYREFVEGFIGTSVSEARVSEKQASIRSLFSKWDGLKLERIVGTERVKSMLAGAGDTFDFV
jgi:U3 small nucleolar RNA-associated protein 25